jgi:putative nucleotidyltransferase with HDIG domain
VYSAARRRHWLYYPVYGLSLLAGGSILVYLLLQRWPEKVHWPSLGLFFVFLVFADTKLSAKAIGGGKVLSSKSIVLSLVAIFGPAAAALLDAASALIRGLLLSRTEMRKALFNAAMLALAAGSAGLVYEALPWSEAFAGPGFLVPLLAALIVHSLVNIVMVTLIMSLDSRMTFRRVYRRSFQTVGLERYLDAPFAAMVILLYLQAGAWTLLLYLFPVLIINRSFRLYQRMKEAHVNSIAALTTALEADEPYTHGHSYRVSKYAMKIGRAMGMPDRELEVLEYAGLLHDIGKIAITNDIICKPGRLTDSEWETVKTHPSIGADIVEQIRFLREAGDYVRHHHERPDGKGYPHGLRDGQISLGCHILNACDAFDAMTSDRPYRHAYSVEKAIEELVRFRGTQFDERVVDTILRLYHKGDFGAIETGEPLTRKVLVPPSDPPPLSRVSQSDSPAVPVGAHGDNE